MSSYTKLNVASYTEAERKALLRSAKFNDIEITDDVKLAREIANDAKRYRERALSMKCTTDLQRGDQKRMLMHAEQMLNDARYLQREYDELQVEQKKLESLSIDDIEKQEKKLADLKRRAIEAQKNKKSK